jgi:hypothetical protein
VVQRDFFFLKYRWNLQLYDILKLERNKQVHAQDEKTLWTIQVLVVLCCNYLLNLTHDHNCLQLGCGLWAFGPKGWCEESNGKLIGFLLGKFWDIGVIYVFEINSLA